MTDDHVNTPEGEARRALVLHDRPLVVDLITLTLHHGGFVVRAAKSFAEAEAILAEWSPNMTVVDMDHDDSTALLRLLRASNTLKRSGLPVLGLTRRGDLKTKLRAFDLGVDDILTMPFSPEELLARAIVISRRATGIEPPLIPVIKLGEIEIDIFNRVVRAGASVIHLSGIEESLLYLLASRAGSVVTKEEILDAIWGTDFVAESTIVDRHIRSLRIKLQNDYRHPRFIETIRNKGYRFVPTFSNETWDGGRDPGEEPRD
jgi:two-component system, OmpR family, alkaline phosphatase synthesis response regulator PhoP